MPFLCSHPLSLLKALAIYLSTVPGEVLVPAENLGARFAWSGRQELCVKLA